MFAHALIGSTSRSAARFFRLTSRFGTVFLILPAVAQIAEFEAELDLSFLMPGAKTNLFGYGGPLIRQADPLSVGTANAEKGTVDRLREAIIPPPTDGQPDRLGRSITDIIAAGMAGPGTDFSAAESQGVLQYRLANLSGSGGGTLPAQDFEANFKLSYDFTIKASVGDPARQVAFAQVGFYLRSTGSVNADNWRNKRDDPDDWGTGLSLNESVWAQGADNGNDSLNFSLTLPANSLTLLEVQYWVRGFALSIELPPVPDQDFPDDPPPVLIPESKELGFIALGIALGCCLSRRRPRD